PLLQKKLMSVFHYALKPSGFLILGSSETIGSHSDLFALADKGHHVYSKKVTFAHVSMDFPKQGHVARRDEPAPKAPSDLRPGASILNEANRLILTRYSPPGVVVDPDWNIV